MKLFVILLIYPYFVNAQTGISISTGKVTGKLATSASRVAIVSHYKSKWLSDMNSKLSWQLELSYGRWNNQYFEDIKATTLTPSLKYNWRIKEQDLFVTFGIGAAYLTETRFSSRRFGSNWLFEDKLSFGWQITEQQSVSLSINHYSNANLASVNDGSTFIFLDYSYYWK